MRCGLIVIVIEGDTHCVVWVAIQLQTAGAENRFLGPSTAGERILHGDDGRAARRTLLGDIERERENGAENAISRRWSVRILVVVIPGTAGRGNGETPSERARIGMPDKRSHHDWSKGPKRVPRMLGPDDEKDEMRWGPIFRVDWRWDWSVRHSPRRRNGRAFEPARSAAGAGSRSRPACGPPRRASAARPGSLWR